MKCYNRIDQNRIDSLFNDWESFAFIINYICNSRFKIESNPELNLDKDNIFNQKIVILRNCTVIPTKHDYLKTNCIELAKVP